MDYWERKKITEKEGRLISYCFNVILVTDILCYIVRVYCEYQSCLGHLLLLFDYLQLLNILNYICSKEEETLSVPFSKKTNYMTKTKGSSFTLDMYPCLPFYQGLVMHYTVCILNSKFLFFCFKVYILLDSKVLLNKFLCSTLLKLF